MITFILLLLSAAAVVVVVVVVLFCLFSGSFLCICSVLCGIYVVVLAL